MTGVTPCVMGLARASKFALSRVVKFVCQRRLKLWRMGSYESKKVVTTKLFDCSVTYILGRGRFNGQDTIY